MKNGNSGAMNSPRLGRLTMLNQTGSKRPSRKSASLPRSTMSTGSDVSVALNTSSTTGVVLVPSAFTVTNCEASPTLPEESVADQSTSARLLMGIERGAVGADAGRHVRQIHHQGRAQLQAVGGDARITGGNFHHPAGRRDDDRRLGVLHPHALHTGYRVALTLQVRAEVAHRPGDIRIAYGQQHGGRRCRGCGAGHTGRKR